MFSGYSLFLTPAGRECSLTELIQEATSAFLCSFHSLKTDKVLVISFFYDSVALLDEVS